MTGSTQPVESPFLISLDYELFLGRNPGDIDATLIRPMEALCAVLERHASRAVLFVDVVYLLRLKELSRAHRQLAAQLSQVLGHLETLDGLGHDIQLHLHPHWRDCTYDGTGWQIDTRRYRLQQLGGDIHGLVEESATLLRGISSRPVFAFRAGGWCIQPFEPIRDALSSCGIWLDSTVFADGLCEDTDRDYDFRRTPDLPCWRFSRDPLEPDPAGEFLEIPISSSTLSPLFHWKMFFRQKVLKSAGDASWGIGSKIPHGARYYLDRLLTPMASPVTLDGLKADTLDAAFAAHQRRARPGAIFNVMGHPKSLTPNGIRRLEAFLTKHPSLQSVTFQDLRHLQPGR